MDKYLFFSGDKPTLEDENFSRDALIQGLLERTRELFTDGVVTGFTLSKVGLDLVVAPGVAYRAGERIALAEAAHLTWPAENTWVFVRYTLTDTALKTHYMTATEYLTRRIHASGLRLSTTSATPGADEVLLGRALVGGTAEDLRTFAQVVSDPRLHLPNTDTHTTAASFTVGYMDEEDPGSLVLTVENALAAHPELALLFRSGILNLQDGHGDRVIEIRKIPSKPGTPDLVAGDQKLKIHGLAPERDAELHSALEAHQAAAVSVDTLSTHLTELGSYRSLVNAKRLLGYTLDQIRGTALVGAAYDLDVRTAKDQAIVLGAAGTGREPGTLALLTSFALVVGTGTSLTSGLVGKKLLFQSDGLLKEYTVQSVDTGAQTLTLTANAAETAGACYFYLADVESLGYAAAVTSAAEMLAKIDLHIGDKSDARAELNVVKAAQGEVVLRAFTTLDASADESYSLLVTWDRPALVDLEEIRSYRMRVYELKHTRTAIASGITKGTLESTHADLIHRVTELGTALRRKREVVQASDVTGAGSTTTLVKVAGAAIFQPATRVEVDGVSAVIKAFNSVTHTIELLNPLSAPPAAGLTLTNYALAWEDDVFSERLELPIRGGQHLVIYAQTVTEFDVGGDWSDGLPILTDTLEDADGVTLAERIRRLRDLARGRFGVERDKVVADVQEQVVALQQQIASAPTQDQFDAVVATLEAIQASL